MQTDGFNNTLFTFFSKALLNARWKTRPDCNILHHYQHTVLVLYWWHCAPVRQEKHLTVLEHLVSALNVFLKSVSVNCRMRVCCLGEELLPAVLFVWADMRPSASLKEEIVQFFKLQMCVHHPKGARTQDTGNVGLVNHSLFSSKALFDVVLVLHSSQNRSTQII